MIAVVEINASRLAVVLTPEAEDVNVSGRSESGRRSFSVWSPEGLPFGDVHPDLVALSVFLVAQPWTTTRLVIKRIDGISERLAHAVQAGYGVELTGGGDVEPRSSVRRGRPGLAFSGGVDSTAAMMLMPSETPLIFLHRVDPDRATSRTRHRSAAARHALASLETMGHETYAVDTDLEHTRRPTGFPTHWANAIPAILLSDPLRLHSISWGTTLEAAYAVGGAAGFQEWSRRSAARKLVRLFAAAGLPVSPVLAGVSEVGTQKIVLGSRYAAVAQSCTEGSRQSCGRCKKCFRKGLLELALSSDRWTTDHLDPYYRDESVRRVLSRVPLDPENVYGFMLSSYAGSDRVLSLLRLQVEADRIDYSLFDRYYSPFLAQLPAADRDHVSRALEDHLDPMTPAQQGRLETWRPVGVEKDLPAHQELLSTLQGFDSPLGASMRQLRSRLRVRTRLRGLLT